MEDSRSFALPMLTFDTQVTGLVPEETYYLLLDYRDVAGGNPAENRTVVFGAIPSSDGTGSSSPLMSTFDADLVTTDWQEDDWFTLGELGLNSERWLQMRLLSSQATSVVGDFDNDGRLTANDIDLLSQELGLDMPDLSFDLNSDGLVDINDHRIWVEDESFANTFLGDANLDGTVDFPDFLTLSAGFGNEGGWAKGDFDGNGQVAFPDFLALSENFGQSSGTVAAVPEPSAHYLIGVGLLVIARLRRYV